MTDHRYVIYGAGAVGSVLGGMLQRAGRSSVLVARPAHAAAIRENGLNLKTLTEAYKVEIPAVERVSELTPRPGDVIFLCVKGTQTAAAVADLATVFPSDTPVVCMQNGVRNEEAVATRFPNTYGALVLFNAVLPTPGTAVLTLVDSVMIGNFPSGTNEHTETIVADLAAAGFPSVTNADVMAVKWGKLIGNLNNALLAVTDCYWQKAFATPRILERMRELMGEGLRVLAAAGISPKDVTGKFDIKAQVEHYAAQTIEFQELPPGQRAYPSMWQDLHFRRPETEVAFLNGEIARLGRECGIPTPFNAVLVEAVNESVATGNGAGQFPLERILELVEQRKQELSK